MRVIVHDFRKETGQEKPGEPLGRLRVELELAPPLDQFARSKRLERSLISTLSDLADDLGLPVQVSLQVRKAKKDSAADGRAYRVWLNGQPCRLPWLLSPAEEELTVEDLARRAAEVIFLNRDNCLEPGLLARIWETWRSPADTSPDDLPPEVLHLLLSELVSRGFNLERARNAPALSQPGLLAPGLAGRLFEEAVSGVESLALNVFLNPERAAQLEQGAPISPADDYPLLEMFDLMLDGLFYELGIALPQPRLLPDERLKPGEFRIKVNDLRLPAQPGLEADEFIVNALPEQLSSLGFTGQLAINPANGNEVCRLKVSGENLDELKQAGYSTWGPEGYLVLSVSQVARAHAGCFLNAGLLGYQLKHLGEAFTDLVGAATERFDLFTLVRAFRELLDEEISIRDMRTILDYLLESSIPTDTENNEVENPRRLPARLRFFNRLLPAWKNLLHSREIPPAKTGPAGFGPAASGQDRFGPNSLAEIARIALKRYISHKYTRGQNTLLVFLLQDELERRWMGQAAFTEEDTGQIRQVLWAELRKLPAGSPQPVILTSLVLRRRLRLLIEKEFPQVAVLAHEELSPDVNIQPLWLPWEAGETSQAAARVQDQFASV